LFVIIAADAIESEEHRSLRFWVGIQQIPGFCVAGGDFGNLLPQISFRVASVPHPAGACGGWNGNCIVSICEVKKAYYRTSH